MPVGPFYEITALHLHPPFAVFLLMFWLKAGSRAVGESSHTQGKNKVKRFSMVTGGWGLHRGQRMFNLKSGESKTGCAHL